MSVLVTTLGGSSVVRSVGERMCPFCCAAAVESSVVRSLTQSSQPYDCVNDYVYDYVYEYVYLNVNVYIWGQLEEEEGEEEAAGRRGRETRSWGPDLLAWLGYYMTTFPPNRYFTFWFG